MTPIWTSSQRRGLAVLFGAAVLILTLRLTQNRRVVPEAESATAPLAGALQTRIDPNTATAAELAAIPDFGEKKAAAVVEYRSAWQANHPNSPAFSQPDDLMHIKGIGPATEQMLEGYLRFPTAK